MSLTNSILIHTYFLEALAIIEKWQSKKENKQLDRLAELMLELLNSSGEKDLEIKDLKLANTLMRDAKNKEILRLKDLLINKNEECNLIA
tara:strand:+ start:718 stop:987 length:270 start_codon:yes stop_codon:yes gene_type:complete